MAKITLELEWGDTPTGYHVEQLRALKDLLYRLADGNEASKKVREWLERAAENLTEAEAQELEELIDAAQCDRAP